MKVPLSVDHDVTGSFRQFGPDGVVYEVLHTNDQRAKIRVLHSGEELDYALSDLLKDPLAP